jgi:hypothetical protein
MKMPFPALLTTLTAIIILAASASATPPDQPVQQAALVRKAIIEKVHSESQLLAIMEGLGEMDGIIDVQRLDFSRDTHEAQIEITMEPAADKYWRAYLERLLQPPSGSRQLPDWYTRDTKAQEKPLARRATFSKVESETQLHGIKRVIEMMKDVLSVSVSSWNSEAQTAVLDVTLVPDNETSWDEFVVALDAARSGASATKTIQP